MKALILIIIISFASGCALFKKTTKTKVEDKRELTKQTELNKLELKTAQKETKVITYWPDGSVYQQEHIIEQMDKAKFGRLEMEEKQVEKQKGTQTESVPSWKVLLIIAVVLVVLAAWIYQSIKD